MIEVLGVSWCIAVLLVIDALLHKHNEKVRWYAIHCMTNAAVVITTAPNVYRFMTEFNPQFRYAILFPSVLIMSLHIFHCLFFNTNRQDIIHHVVMSLVLLIPLYNSDNVQFVAFSNYALFFLSGLPGGIDYFLMTMVESGKMDRLTEKYYNQYLNTWVRSIGILYGVFCCYQQWLMGAVQACWAWPAILAMTWNAQYYSSQVAQSYGFHAGKQSVAKASS